VSRTCPGLSVRDADGLSGGFFRRQALQRRGDQVFLLLLVQGGDTRGVRRGHGASGIQKLVLGIEFLLQPMADLYGLPLKEVRGRCRWLVNLVYVAEGFGGIISGSRAWVNLALDGQGAAIDVGAIAAEIQALRRGRGPRASRRAAPLRCRGRPWPPRAPSRRCPRKCRCNSAVPTCYRRNEQRRPPRRRLRLSSRRVTEPRLAAQEPEPSKKQRCRPGSRGRRFDRQGAGNGTRLPPAERFARRSP